MKLVTYSPLPSGMPRAGILLDDKKIVEATGFPTMLDIIRGGAAAMDKLKALAAKPAPHQERVLRGLELPRAFRGGGEEARGEARAAQASGVLQQGANRRE